MAGAQGACTSVPAGFIQSLDARILPSLEEQILSDAQAAIFEKSLRRAVLETAIACEVAVKQVFFGRSSVAGSAYEYLEDKGRVNVRVLDLISGAAEYVFGRSFRKDRDSHYTQIDYLFRCRNKVAHRGEPVYRDDGGTEHEADRETLVRWWESVAVLIEWLSEISESAEPENGC